MYLKSYFIGAGKNVLIRFPKRVIRLFEFFFEYARFKKMNDDRLKMNFLEIYPCLNDKTTITPFDRHYTYHPAWAARILAKTRPAYHTDISSILSFSTIVSAFIPVKFYDYRPAEISLENFESKAADLTNLHFETGSIPSLSCMHTVEHIGLGRYGDALDPSGDIKAINEIKRVVVKGGDILFVVPMGDAMIQFNGQRLYTKEQIIEYFSGCELMEFTLIADQGGLIINASNEIIKDQKYPCGCFWFKKQ